jgi:hypothetical protein
MIATCIGFSSWSISPSNEDYSPSRTASQIKTLPVRTLGTVFPVLLEYLPLSSDNTFGRHEPGIFRKIDGWGESPGNAPGIPGSNVGEVRVVTRCCATLSPYSILGARFFLFNKFPIIPVERSEWGI